MYAPEVNVRVFPGPGSDAAQLALLRLAAAAPWEIARSSRNRKIKRTWSFIPVEFVMFCMSMGVFAGLFLWQSGRLEPWLKSAQVLLAQIGIR